MDPQQVSDLHEIHLLKARYFRFMDTRQWDRFRELFTDDLEYYISNSRLPESTTPLFTKADQLVSYLSASEPEKITVHHGHTPEIELIDDSTASGVWAMFGWTDEPGRGFAMQSFGHYHERYVRGEDGKWRISSIHLTRLRLNRVNPQPSEGVDVIDRGVLGSLPQG
jgi:SnoaL-like domain